MCVWVLLSALSPLLPLALTFGYGCLNVFLFGRRSHGNQCSKFVVSAGGQTLGVGTRTACGNCEQCCVDNFSKL